MQQAHRGAVFKVLVALACIYGCVLFVGVISWLWPTLHSLHGGEHTEWQGYTMSLLLLSFAPLAALGIWRSTLASRLFLLLAGVSVFQAICITQSTGDGTGAAIAGCLVMVGLPALLAAGLYGWQGRTRQSGLPITISPVRSMHARSSGKSGK